MAAIVSKTTSPGAEALDNESQAEHISDRGLIIEHDAEDAQVDVVAIHGFGGGRRKTWTRGADENDCWLSTVFPGRVMLYGYDTSINSLPFRRRDIIREAKLLLQSLRECRDKVEVSRRPVIFVSHGMGGLIVKAAIIIASRDPTLYEYLLPDVRILVFFEFPHISGNIDFLKMDLRAHMKDVLGMVTDTEAIFLLEASCVLAETIEEINGMFLNSKMAVQAVTIDYYSQATPSGSYFKGFSRAITRMRRSFGFRQAVNREHRSVTRLSDDEVTQMQSHAGQWIKKGLSPDQEHAIRDFVSQASPTFPPSHGAIPTALIPAIKKLLDTDQNMVLHVQTTSDDDSSVFEGICSYLFSEADDHAIIDFKFDDFDTRFSSIDNMLRTIISQHICEQITEESALSVASYLAKFSAIGTRDLLYYFGRVIPSDLTKPYPFLYVIDGLDKCGEGACDFVAYLRFLLESEAHRFKVVIRTSLGANDHLLSASVSRIQPDFFTAFVMEQKESDVKISTPRLCIGRVGFSSQALAVLDELEDAFGDDLCLLSLLQNWLDPDSRALSAVEHDLRKLKGATLSRIFAALLSDMPAERRTWASTILLWVSLAFRPLLIEELCVLSHLTRISTSEGARYENYQQILGFFNGILKTCHGEVRFAHPEIRAWLKYNVAERGLDWSSTQAWWQKIQGGEEGHAQILRTCLEYLTKPQPFHHLQCFTDWPAAHSFPYAAEYWPSHYRMSGNSRATVTEKVLAIPLLLDHTLRTQWMRFYSSHVNCLARSAPDTLEPAAIAANLGLEDLVENLISIQGFSESPASEGVSAIMVEAAKSGNINILRRFLPDTSAQLRLEDQGLESLVRAAVTSSCSDIVDEIVKRMPSARAEGLDLPSWTSDLFLLAVWTDNVSLARRLLELGTDPGVSFEVQAGYSVGPVGIAVMHNAISVINLLIERGYNLTPETGIEQPSLINTVVIWGSSEIIRLLFANGLRANALNTWGGRTLLEGAAIWGRYELLDTLLEFAELGQYLRYGSDHPLITTARRGYAKSNEVLLKHGADPNANDERGNALKCAILSDNWQVCRQLFEQPELNVDHGGSDGKAPLLVAVWSKWEKEIIKCLIERGANIEAREPGEWKRTALLLATSRLAPASEVVKILLEHGADITARDSDGWTPLFTAATFGPVEVVQQLIDAGSDVSAICGVEQRTALHAAAHRPEVLPVLLAQGLDPSIEGLAEHSPLELAASRSPAGVRLMLNSPLENKVALSISLCGAVRSDMGPQDKYQSVEMLLEAGADPNHIDSTGIPLLKYAVEKGDGPIVQILLEFRADINARDVWGNNALHSLGSLASVPLAKLLVNAGAKLDAINQAGNTPLIRVVNSGNWDVFRYLLSKKETRLTINVAGPCGTALHRICRLYDSNNLDLMKLLVENGADVNLYCARFHVGTPLLQCCLRSGDNYAPAKEEMVIYLLGKNAKVDSWQDGTSLIHAASMCCSPNIIKILVAKGADPEYLDHMNRKPLHLACYNSLAAVETLTGILEEKGASSETSSNAGLGHHFAMKDVLGRVPLHFAVATSDIAFITYVLEQSLAAGLSVDVRDHDGWTPLLWALRDVNVFKWHDRDRHLGDVVRLLLDHGAGPAVRVSVPHVMEAEGNEWFAVDVGRYYGASSEAIELLEEWFPQARERYESSKIGDLYQGWLCEGCELEQVGIYHKCQDCPDYLLCFKCYGHHDSFHPPHDFVQGGTHHGVQIPVVEDAGSVASATSWETKSGSGDDTYDDYDLDLNSDVVSDDDTS
ncbi:hypothetical protein PspLS_04037 [Pyricularia sp. CBS 133598]|nr:hypothetical protein PspLS_04037 [Pyricularia sp. CBS 133598]